MGAVMVSNGERSARERGVDVLPLPEGRWRRASATVAPLVHVYLAVVAAAGATRAAESDFAGADVAAVLYLVAAHVSAALAVTLVALRLRVRRGGGLLLQPMQALYLTAPLGGAFLLAAAYVSRLNGGSFAGGFEAMVGTTLALVLLARRVSELRLGSAGPVSGPIRVPAVPALAPGEGAGTGTDEARLP